MKRRLFVIIALCFVLSAGFAEVTFTAEQAAFVLPAGAAQIEAEAFAGIGAESVYLPDGLEEIGGGAFAGCEKLAVIRIPASVESIAEDAFSGCPSTLRVYGMPDSAAHAFAKKQGYRFFHEITGKEVNNTLPVLPID